MDRLTEVLYGRDRFSIKPGVPEEALDVVEAVLGFRLPQGIVEPILGHL